MVFRAMVLLVGGMTPRRLGRLVQRLLEIETYRMAALPACRPRARLLLYWPLPSVSWPSWPTPSARPTATMSLRCWTASPGWPGRWKASTRPRIPASASSAYFELVDKRIQDIAESRLAGKQTIVEAHGPASDSLRAAPRSGLRAARMRCPRSRA